MPAAPRTSPQESDHGPFAPPATISPYEGEDPCDDGTMKVGGRNVDFEKPRLVEAHQAGLKAGLQFTWPSTNNVIDMSSPEALSQITTSRLG